MIDSLRTQFADCRVRHEMLRIENNELQSDKQFLARALRVAHETIKELKHD